MNEVEVPEYRAMKLRCVRDDAMQRRYEPHIEPINRLVDELRKKERGGMPYVDARYYGVNAEVLFLLQDPGPGTDAEMSGSGFLSPQNDDPSAERLLRCLNKASLRVDRVITWNAYPWIMKPGEGLTVKRLDEGGEVLVRLLGLLPRLKVVVTMGKKARQCWERLQRRCPEVTRAYHALETHHTSSRGITDGGKLSATEGEAKVCDEMREAMRLIGL